MFHGMSVVKDSKIWYTGAHAEEADRIISDREGVGPHSVTTDTCPVSLTTSILKGI